MPSRDVARVLSTISHNIALARRFVDGLSYDAFAHDQRSQYAVTRCLEIVSEASRRLPPDIRGRHPQVPWDRIAGAGNVYRHDYEDVLPELLWNTILNHLDTLEEAVREESERLTGGNA